MIPSRPRRRLAPPAWRAIARKLHRRVVHPLLDFVLPTDCFCCGAPLDALQQLGACSGCWAGFRSIRAPYCTRCGLVRPESTDLLGPARGRCAACVLDPPLAGSVRTAVVYDDHARRFLLRAKFGGHRELLARLGDQLAAAVRDAGTAEACRAIVPVPSHPWSDLRRGFSPAVEIGRRLARREGLPLRRGWLKRRFRPWAASKRLGAARRRELARAAIRCPRRLPRGRLLLVDDVLTSGATVRACVSALRSSGADDVHVAVWGRALPPNWG